MKTMEVDVAVIGAGTAGLAAYRAAKAAGASAARPSALCSPITKSEVGLLGLFGVTHLR